MELMDELLELADAIHPFTICGEGNVSCEFINIHRILGYCKNSAKNSYGSHIIFHEDYC